MSSLCFSGYIGERCCISIISFSVEALSEQRNGLEQMWLLMATCRSLSLFAVCYVDIQGFSWIVYIVTEFSSLFILALNCRGLQRARVKTKLLISVIYQANIAFFVGIPSSRRDLRELLSFVLLCLLSSVWLSGAWVSMFSIRDMYE